MYRPCFHVDFSVPRSATQPLEDPLICDRLLGSSGEAQNKFIETLFDRTEWVQGVTIPIEAAPIDLKARTQCYFSSNFGNLPFSSGIKANHYPPAAQRSQLQNYYAKHNWEMMTANDGHGMASVTKAWADTMNKARQLIASGVKPEELTGAFPTVTALFDKREYDTAPMISKWAVQFIYSSQHDDYSFTSMASVWIVWVIMRWMINPTPDTYSVSVIPSPLSNWRRLSSRVAVGYLFKYEELG